MCVCYHNNQCHKAGGLKLQTPRIGVASAFLLGGVAPSMCVMSSLSQHFPESSLLLLFSGEDMGHLRSVFQICGIWDAGGRVPWRGMTSLLSQKSPHGGGSAQLKAETR